MLDITKNGFAELTCEEMTEVGGGLGWLAVGSVLLWTAKILWWTPTYVY